MKVWVANGRYLCEGVSANGWYLYKGRLLLGGTCMKAGY